MTCADIVEMYIDVKSLIKHAIEVSFALLITLVCNFLLLSFNYISRNMSPRSFIIEVTLLNLLI